MTATRNEISGWLDRLYEDENLTHMLVVCDIFDWDDYPVYVSKDEDVHKVAAKHDTYRFLQSGSGMDQLMEVYSKSLPKDSQLTEIRSFHYD